MLGVVDDGDNVAKGSSRVEEMKAQSESDEAKARAGGEARALCEVANVLGMFCDSAGGAMVMACGSREK